MPSVQNGDMVWTSADLGALIDDKELLDYLIAHIQASAPAAYVTGFQDANACSARAQQLLGGDTQVREPRSMKASREGKPAKRKTSKKKTASKKRKAPARGKKHHK